MAEIVGFDELLARLQRIRSNVSNLRSPHKESSDYQLGSVDLNFEAGGRPRWPKLKAATLRRKKGTILNETGTMRGSNKPSYSGQGWEIFNTDWKAAFHLDGTEVDGEEHIPARNWLVFQPEDVTEIGSIYMGHITR
jgi:phage gpG-like protein